LPAQTPLQHGAKKRSADTRPLVVRVDEQLIDMRADRRQIRDDGIAGADDVPPVPRLELAGVPAPNVIL
jgi:hypothetical protein